MTVALVYTVRVPTTSTATHVRVPPATRVTNVKVSTANAVIFVGILKYFTNFLYSKVIRDQLER